MTKMIRRVIPAQISALGEDEVEIVMSTAAIARDEHILVPEGCILENYRRNPIQLWQHDPDHPVGRNEDIQVYPDRITARCRFAPLGISRKADEIRGLVKAGILNAVSVGFDVVESEPLDPKKPRGGQRITSWELLECSFVSVPADTMAVVTARALEEEQKKMAEALAVKIELDTTELTRALKNARARVRRMKDKPDFKRGLYDVASLAYLLSELGYTHSCAAWEAESEGDGSKVPGMIGEAMMALGEALVAMTHEEVAELMSGHGMVIEPEDDSAVTVEERAHIDAATTETGKAWRRATLAVKTRAGKKMSDDMVRCMREIMEDHSDAMDHSDEAKRLHKRALAKSDEMMDRAGANAEAEPAADAQQADGSKPDDSARAAEIAEADHRRRQADALMLRGTFH
jgi:HK97 family phage prohead protease